MLSKKNCKHFYTRVIFRESDRERERASERYRTISLSVTNSNKSIKDWVSVTVVCVVYLCGGSLSLCLHLCVHHFKVQQHLGCTIIAWLLCSCCGVWLTRWLWERMSIVLSTHTYVCDILWWWVLTCIKPVAIVWVWWGCFFFLLDSVWDCLPLTTTVAAAACVFLVSVLLQRYANLCCSAIVTTWRPKTVCA